MIARLQLFYGGSPMDWLRIPLTVVRAYLSMLPRLRSEEALQHVSEVMIGTGSMEKKYAQRTLKDWQREAEGPREAPPQMTPQERAEHYAATGIFQVELVPAPAPEEVTGG